MSSNEPMKLRMLTIEPGMELELIFDDESIESLDDLELTSNYFGSYYKLNIKKKAQTSQPSTD